MAEEQRVFVRCTILAINDDGFCRYQISDYDHTSTTTHVCGACAKFDRFLDEHGNKIDFNNLNLNRYSQPLRAYAAAWSCKAADGTEEFKLPIGLDNHMPVKASLIKREAVVRYAFGARNTTRQVAEEKPMIRSNDYVFLPCHAAINRVMTKGDGNQRTFYDYTLKLPNDPIFYGVTDNTNLFHVDFKTVLADVTHTIPPNYTEAMLKVRVSATGPGVVNVELPVRRGNVDEVVIKRVNHLCDSDGHEMFIGNPSITAPDGGTDEIIRLKDNLARCREEIDKITKEKNKLAEELRVQKAHGDVAARTVTTKDLQIDKMAAKYGELGKSHGSLVDAHEKLKVELAGVRKLVEAFQKELEATKLQGHNYRTKLADSIRGGVKDLVDAKCITERDAYVINKVLEVLTIGTKFPTGDDLYKALWTSTPVAEPGAVQKDDDNKMLGDVIVAWSKLVDASKNDSKAFCKINDAIATKVSGPDPQPKPQEQPMTTPEFPAIEITNNPAYAGVFVRCEVKQSLYSRDRVFYQEPASYDAYNGHVWPEFFHDNTGRQYRANEKDELIRSKVAFVRASKAKFIQTGPNVNKWEVELSASSGNCACFVSAHNILIIAPLAPDKVQAQPSTDFVDNQLMHRLFRGIADNVDVDNRALRELAADLAVWFNRGCDPTATTTLLDIFKAHAGVANNNAVRTANEDRKKTRDNVANQLRSLANMLGTFPSLATKRDQMLIFTLAENFDAPESAGDTLLDKAKAVLAAHPMPPAVDPNEDAARLDAARANAIYSHRRRLGSAIRAAAIRLKENGVFFAPTAASTCAFASFVAKHSLDLTATTGSSEIAADNKWAEECAHFVTHDYDRRLAVKEENDRYDKDTAQRKLDAVAEYKAATKTRCLNVASFLAKGVGVTAAPFATYFAFAGDSGSFMPALLLTLSSIAAGRAIDPRDKQAPKVADPKPKDDSWRPDWA